MNDADANQAGLDRAERRIEENNERRRKDKAKTWLAGIIVGMLVLMMVALGGTGK